MKKILFSSIIFLTSLMVSCDDLLDKQPLDKLSPDSFFSNENELQAFSKSFYHCFPSTDIYSENMDHVVNTEMAEEMRDGRTVPSSGGGWTWDYLRDFNTLIAYSSNCEDEDVRNEYVALARFFRAYFYYDKVKRFGDVPWYETLLDSDSEELSRPRDSREYVMQKMIEDIDFAIDYLSEDREVYRVTKWTALALKARFCLFEGTFRKYHSLNQYDTDYTWYLEQAADAASDFMAYSGYSLYTGATTSTNYLYLFASMNAQSTEIILARDYNATYSVVHNVNFYIHSQSFGRPGVTRKIVDSYLMSDGSRFTDKDGYQTYSYEDQCTGRDPRLSQTILTPGYKRIDGSSETVVNLSETTTGYQLIKYVTSASYDGYNTSCNDLPIFRSAEVLLAYAEAKAELGTLTQSDLDKSVNLLRSRVGMPSLSLDTANANPDPYLMSSSTGYPDVSGSNTGVILEIRRERTIELMQEGFRYDDILRWRAGQTLVQDVYGIYIAQTGAQDLNGDGTTDVYIIKSTESGSSSILTLVVDQDVILSEGPICHSEHWRQRWV